MLRAREAAEAGDHNEAIRLFWLSIEKGPFSGAAYLMLADALRGEEFFRLQSILLGLGCSKISFLPEVPDFVVDFLNSTWADEAAGARHTEIGERWLRGLKVSNTDGDPLELCTAHCGVSGFAAAGIRPN